MSQVAHVGFSGFLQVPKRGFVSSDILSPMCETILSVTERYIFLCLHSSSCVTSYNQFYLPYQQGISIVLRNKNVLGAMAV